MKQLFFTSIALLFIFSLKAQENIALKTSLGVDGYNINYDDSFFAGAKIGVEMAVLKKLTVGFNVGYNVASAKSAVAYFGFDTRYYFGKQVFQGFYTELGAGYSAFKFIDVPEYKAEFLPNKTVSLFLNGGVQRIIKHNTLLGFKLGMGIFGPNGSTSPALRLQAALEMGYKF
jgi:Protein of unknown function (DUF3575)